jgi:ribosomal protein L11 methyltransferase
MTNFCLRTGPMPTALADAAAGMLENLSDAPPLSLSLTDREEHGWEVEGQYASRAVAELAAAALGALPIAKHAIVISPLPDIDWVRHSLEGLAPVVAGRFIVHGSHHRFLRPRHSTLIEIDAATAFGTGHHATTRGCLLALDRMLKSENPRRALDIGCGTGVLAIAFARASRRPVLATDIDPEAVRVTIGNAQLNGVGRLVRAVKVSPLGTAAITGPFDIIFANLLARPLLVLAPEIARLAGQRGTAVLSGLYGEQERSVMANYRLVGFRLSFRLRLEGWSTLVLSRG